nr:ribonuclease H-like domain-containing protein [Tanacetum cinerariifolium]
MEGLLFFPQRLQRNTLQFRGNQRIYGMQSKLEGLHKGYDRMQKILSQLNQLKAKPEDEDINLKFLRALPSSWSQVALTLKTKGELELLYFDDLHYKLKTLKVHVKGYTTFSSSQSAGPSHSAFVSATSASKKMSYGDSPSYASTTTYSVPSNSKTRSQRPSNTDHDGESDGVIASKEFGMIAGCETEDAIKKGAAKIYNLITGADTKEASTTGDAGEFALMGVTSEVHNCPFGCDNKLIDSSMSVRTKVGLGFNNCIRENELGWDDSTFSVFTTNSEDVEGSPLFHRFAKVDSMKVVPLPLSGDYTSLSDHSDLDESQMSYGTKSSNSSDSKSVSNDFVSCDDSDKSLEVNTNDFASSDSSVKSSEPKPTDSTSYASTFSDLPSFTCTSSDKNENTSRTSCNKIGYFNKKAGHFRKNASSVSKLCLVCVSGTHLIMDCDFYEKQMANKTVGIRVGPEHCRDKVNHQNQFVPQALLLRTSKVNIPPARPQPVPT